MGISSTAKETLQAHHLAPSKKFGQNFLVNENTARRIAHAGDIEKDDTIIEVGVGLGALTVPLAERAQRVIGVEVDSGIIRYHEEQRDLPDNVTLLHQDILKMDFQELFQQVGSRLKFMANLPYSISNPFLFKLIDNRHLLQSATIMLQKEVADRLTAKPGSKQYGIPTVLLRSCASVEKLITLRPGEFHPRPKVDSVVVKIIFSPTPAHILTLPDYPYTILQTLVRAAFGQRRKTLANTLSSCGLFTPFFSEKRMIREKTRQTILESGIKPEIRGEMLDLVQFISLARSFDTTIQTLQN